MRFKPHSGGGSAAAAGRADPAVYKRMVIALRSLHSFVRVLPAYRLHRTCKVRPPPAPHTAHRSSRWSASPVDTCLSCNYGSRCSTP